MTPLAYLAGSGAQADAIAPLTWGLIAISVVVTVIVTVLVVIATLRHRPAGTGVSAGADGTRWITIGVAISCLPLLAALLWTMRVLAAVSSPKQQPALTVDVTGEQWWWRVQYAPDDPARGFATANEIHIPVGQRVRVMLHASDVIHSFWVPALAGKTDTIPGMTNETWIAADRPGRYLGQCTEFCGAQHAHMQFTVIADPPEVFAAWVEQQRTRAAHDDAEDGGEALFVYRCGACHAVRGTEAAGSVAPDLTHLMSRDAIAAGTLPNTPDALSAWMEDPQGIKPGNRMPQLNLTVAERASIGAYLQTLK